VRYKPLVLASNDKVCPMFEQYNWHGYFKRYAPRKIFGYVTFNSKIMAFSISRDVECGGAVRCDAALSTTSATTLRGVSWPSVSGTAGQILCLVSPSESQWASAGSAAYGYTRATTTAATYTMSAAAEILFVDRALGATITLPSVASAGDKFYVIADKSGGISSTAPIVIEAAGSDTIMGEPSFSLKAPYNSAKLVHDSDAMWLLV
jgi:hypothetical protein